MKLGKVSDFIYMQNGAGISENPKQQCCVNVEGSYFKYLK
jgi:hypothetical protein